MFILEIQELYLYTISYCSLRSSGPTGASSNSLAGNKRSSLIKPQWFSTKMEGTPLRLSIKVYMWWSVFDYYNNWRRVDFTFSGEGEGLSNILYLLFKTSSAYFIYFIESLIMVHMMFYIVDLNFVHADASELYLGFYA